MLGRTGSSPHSLSGPHELPYEDLVMQSNQIAWTENIHVSLSFNPRVLEQHYYVAILTALPFIFITLPQDGSAPSGVVYVIIASQIVSGFATLRLLGRLFFLQNSAGHLVAYPLQNVIKSILLFFLY